MAKRKPFESFEAFVRLSSSGYHYLDVIQPKMKGTDWKDGDKVRVRVEFKREHKEVTDGHSL